MRKREVCHAPHETALQKMAIEEYEKLMKELINVNTQKKPNIQKVTEHVEKALTKMKAIKQVKDNIDSLVKETIREIKTKK